MKIEYIRNEENIVKEGIDRLKIINWLLVLIENWEIEILTGLIVGTSLFKKIRKKKGNKNVKASELNNKELLELLTKTVEFLKVKNEEQEIEVKEVEELKLEPIEEDDELIEVKRIINILENNEYELIDTYLIVKGHFKKLRELQDRYEYPKYLEKLINE